METWFRALETNYQDSNPSSPISQLHDFSNFPNQSMPWFSHLHYRDGKTTHFLELLQRVDEFINSQALSKFQLWWLTLNQHPHTSNYMQSLCEGLGIQWETRHASSLPPLSSLSYSCGSFQTNGHKFFAFFPLRGGSNVPSPWIWEVPGVLQPIEYHKSVAIQLPRLGHQRTCSFCLVLFIRSFCTIHHGRGPTTWRPSCWKGHASGLH